MQRQSNRIGEVTAPASLRRADEGLSPSVAAIAGTYIATSIATTREGVTRDQLATGVTLTIVLAPDGTTTGSLFVPGAPVDMSGTWSHAGATVRIAQPIETFVRHIPLQATPSQLIGDAPFSGTTIRVTLSKLESD